MGVRLKRSSSNYYHPSGQQNAESGERDDLGRTHACAVSGLVVRLLLRSPLCLDPGEVMLDLLALLLVAPPEHWGHERCGGDGRGHPSVPGLDRDPGATGQHVVQMASALVTDGIDNLGRQIVVGTRKPLCQNRIGDAQIEHLDGQRAVSLEQMLNPRNMNAVLGRGAMAGVPGGVITLR